MLRSKIGVWRLLALVAVVIMIQAHAASVVVNAAGQGRDLSACVQACNAFKAACGDTCHMDCEVWFTPGTPEYDNCVFVCTADCAVEMQECKKKCNINHEPPTIVEP